MKILTASRFYSKIARIAICGLMACSNYDPVSEDYFSSNDKILGNEKPAVPSNYTILKDDTTLTLSWTAPKDPDTGEYAEAYYFYEYPELNLPANPYADNLLWNVFAAELVCQENTCSLTATLSSSDYSSCLGVAAFADFRISDVTNACF